MTKMYYDENPDSIHDIHELKVNLLNHPFTFYTDSGVFSKKMIDFGSQVLLNALNFHPNDTLLDLGCGYGPLGITLAKVQGVKATLVDINNRAIDLAKRNAEKNQADVSIFQSNIYENISDSYHHIISNPPIRAGKKVVHEIIEKSIDYLVDGGDLTIVIQKKQGAPSAKEKMADIFGNVDVLKKDKGYYILRSIKHENS
ncbi:class I SAM-dependent methyltransferase [Streptococcus iniae]|uniref:Methyltransferase n=1 Tax=Streptococcus iniae TaxID=1346 RepID=A0A1J0MYU9_STRIN|nr:class I SAM-dependent methyltransferase [Streptococcus iniae]AGM98761.1 16S rRNA m(2)G 1207 methyltransferase [Streptococcus iniae SF1]AHY15725.1 methyltransferase [Streptococcus iniae]AHY17593.1 methyltransferase [Streptococcus iniae]AJG25890.1 methyltransferase [Streptococcus iniae]APD31764.1 methyltransferase [Streptococcus iniae]